MVNVIEQLWFGLVLCGIAVLCGVAGYYEYRNAEALCRRGAETAEGMPRLLRWLARPNFFANPECISRYRSIGILHMIMSVVCLVAGIATMLMAVAAALGVYDPVIPTI